MTENQQRTSSGPNRIVLILVTVLVLGMFLYAFVQNRSEQEPLGAESVETSDPTEELMGNSTGEPTGSEAESSEETESSEPEDSEPVSSEPVSSEPEESSEPEQPTASQKFSIPSDIVAYFSMSLADLYGYEPEPEDYYEGGEAYSPPGCPYVIVFTTYADDAHEKPVAVVGKISLLFPGKSSYTEKEIKKLLGDVTVDSYWSEADGYYYLNAYVDGYTISFSGDPDALTFFDIRN